MFQEIAGTPPKKRCISKEVGKEKTFVSGITTNTVQNSLLQMGHSSTKSCHSSHRAAGII